MEYSQHAKLGQSAVPESTKALTWTFQYPAGTERVALGPHTYVLRDGAAAVGCADNGIFGPHSAEIRETILLEAPAWVLMPP
ncbi:MAG: hypothetical protein ACOYM3_31505 [Terrimicrobiaceae bacterium]